MTGGLPCIIVNPTAFERWDGDPPGTPIPPEQQARMFQNLRAATEFQGLRLVIERGESPYTP
jgi:hypothetical protein